MIKNVHKSIFLIVGIALFTAQLSYKFYEYASQPVARVKATHARSVYQYNRQLHRYDHRLAFSLDKRYNLQEIVTVMTPVFRFDPPTPAIRPEAYDPEFPVFFHPVIKPALRGPPMA